MTTKGGENMAKKYITVFRSSVTGQFTTPQKAVKSPATHEKERIRKK
jgi:hypothetical protein